MTNPKDRYTVVYPGGCRESYQTLRQARRERDRFDRCQWSTGLVALIYDNIRKDYVE